MSQWPQQTFGRPDTAAGRGAGGLDPGDAARRNAADDRSDARRAGDDDWQRSQRLAAAKRFDLDGQIG